MQVSLEVRPTCQVTAQPMVFEGKAGMTIDAEALIDVTCNGEMPVSLALDAGTHALDGERRLAGPNGYVSYAVYMDAARTDQWDPLQPRSLGSGGRGFSLTAYGRVDAHATWGAVGSYSDTVVVTVDF